jgi:hypothetical protein
VKPQVYERESFPQHAQARSRRLILAQKFCGAKCGVDVLQEENFASKKQIFKANSLTEPRAPDDGTHIL